MKNPVKKNMDKLHRPKVQATEFSKFIRGEGKYTPEYKKEVMLEVAERAVERQMREAGFKSGEDNGQGTEN